MKKAYLNVFGIGLLFASITLTSCEKHSKKIVDNYTGILTKNDSITINNAVVILKEIDKNNISVESDYFQSYTVTISKKRYFSSKIYYSITADEQLEVNDLSTITIVHNDNGDSYSFIGTRD